MQYALLYALLHRDCGSSEPVVRDSYWPLTERAYVSSCT